jgi:hypothetical protein
MGKPLVRFREGQEIQPGYGRDIVAPSRKQVVTEKTNFFLQSRKAPVYSKDQICSLASRFVEANRGKIFQPWGPIPSPDWTGHLLTFLD